MIRSPASAQTASLESTTSLARATVSGGNSCICGVKAPMALTCAPGARSPSANTGRVDVVAVQTTSASRTAAAALSATSTGTPSSAESSSRKRWAASARVSKTRTSSTGRTAQTAASWVRPWPPVPSTATRDASERERSSVAAPEAAPVRRAVKYVPSRIAVGRPVSASTSVIMAWIVGKPASRLPEKTETIFMPSSSVRSR